MKTQILQLESHDDLISIRDKLGWKQTGRILLVFPKTCGSNLSKRLGKKLDLVLLKRCGENAGAQIAFVTHNRSLAKAASQVGIPVYKDIKQAHKSHWRVHLQESSKRKILSRYSIQLERKSRRELVELQHHIHPHSRFQTTGKTETSNRSRMLKWGIGSLVISAIILATFLLMIPRAQISFTPHTQIQETTVDIFANSNIKAVNLIGDIPARPISTIVEGNDQIKTSGKIDIPLSTSTGKIQLINLTNTSIDVPAGTIISNSLKSNQPAIKFLTTQAGLLPPSYGNENQSQQSILIPIQAQSPGKQANLPANTLDLVHGDIGLRIRAFNPEPTYGGKNRIFSAPTINDQKSLYNNLFQNLQSVAVKELQKAALTSSDKTEGILLSSEPQLKQILSSEYYPADPLTPASVLSLKLRLEFVSWIITGDDIYNMANTVLDSSLPQGYSPQTDPNITLLSLPDKQSSSPLDGENKWKVRFIVQRRIQQNVEHSQIVPLIRGRSISQAAQLLRAHYHLETLPLITVYPSWWQYLPFQNYQISITNQ